MTDETIDTTEVDVETDTEREAPKVEVKAKTVAQPKPKLEPRKEEVVTKDEDHVDDYTSDLRNENIQRRRENKELKKQIADLQKSFDSSREEFELTKKQQQDRIVRATLSNSLSKAGCVDSDTALSLLASKVEFTTDGDVSNGDELVAELKKSKAYFFTGPATSNSTPTPKPLNKGPSVKDMPDREFMQVLKNMGVKNTTF